MWKYVLGGLNTSILLCIELFWDDEMKGKMWHLILIKNLDKSDAKSNKGTYRILSERFH